MMRHDLVLNDERDNNLTRFGKTTLDDRYLFEGETYQEMFARVSTAFADDIDHAQRLYDYMSQLWFMPATPVLTNGGTGRGMPISCFLNTVADTLSSIDETWSENVWLSSKGGGIGTCWSEVRSIHEDIGGRGKSSGIIPFVRVMDSLTLAISQGSLRRGAAAVYLDVSHPEIEEFLQIRKPTGDYNRKSLNIHHGVTIPDSFMQAVEDDADWPLVGRKNGEVIKTVNARKLWQAILEMRLQTGEPYLIFSDTVDRGRCDIYKKLGHRVTQSNLCSEIMLATDPARTAVCCLSSLNLNKWDEWKHDDQFIEDVFRFLDNVLQDFIDRTAGVKGFEKARYSAQEERSVGLGVMGFHSYLQSQMIPFDSPMAKSLNMQMFTRIRAVADRVNLKLGMERGACPDGRRAGHCLRFSNMLAVAPTASISIVCGQASPCIEPWNTNCYVHKTLSGSFVVKNRQLRALLADRGLDTDEVWASIIEHEGSVQHMTDELSDHERHVFKTSWELDQRWVVEFAGDRAGLIDQSQSVNVFLPSDIDKWDLHMLHWSAWKKGVKSLYYCRSKSAQRASTGSAESASTGPSGGLELPSREDYEECLACQ